MITSPLSPATRIVRGNVLSTEISGRMVLMNATKGNYVTLDDTGGQIWPRLERPLTVAELCEELQALYDVDRPVLEHDVLVFLENLRVQGLLEIVPTANAT